MYHIHVHYILHSYHGYQCIIFHLWPFRVLGSNDLRFKWKSGDVMEFLGAPGEMSPNSEGSGDQFLRSAAIW